MKVVRHWVRESARATDSLGEVHRGEAWGWSETNVEEARRRGKVAAERVADWLAKHCQDPEPPRSSEYLYGLDRPPREEIVQELHDATGETTGLITRNVYGALVLNTRDLMFIDVDFPLPPKANGGLLARLFGKAAPPPDVETGVLTRVQSWCTANADRGVRLYRTAAGLRVVVVGSPMQSNGDEARRILQELDSDPLYRRLCEAQECFRARLTPKPWRMKSVKRLHAPPARYPFEDAKAEQRYRQWQREYDEAAPRFATCRLMKTYGPSEAHPDLALLLDLHDSLTGIEQSLPLA